MKRLPGKYLCTARTPLALGQELCHRADHRTPGPP